MLQRVRDFFLKVESKKLHKWKGDNVFADVKISTTPASFIRENMDAKDN